MTSALFADLVEAIERLKLDKDNEEVDKERTVLNSEGIKSPELALITLPKLPSDKSRESQASARLKLDVVVATTDCLLEYYDSY